MSTATTPTTVIAVFKDGKVVLPPGVDWPDGTVVHIDVVKEKRPTVWEVLKKYSGVVDDLPPDAAQNLDHYLYGHPKKKE